MHSVSLRLLSFLLTQALEVWIVDCLTFHWLFKCVYRLIAYDLPRPIGPLILRRSIEPYALCFLSIQHQWRSQDF